MSAWLARAINNIGCATDGSRPKTRIHISTGEMTMQKLLHGKCRLAAPRGSCEGRKGSLLLLSLCYECQMGEALVYIKPVSASCYTLSHKAT